MANNENLLKGKATQFSSENQPANPGRKPSVLRFIRDEGVSITDVKRVIWSLIWEYDSEELAALLKTKPTKKKSKSKGKEQEEEEEKPASIPMGVNIVLGALADDLQKRRLENFEKLMDRTSGKPTQTVDVKTPGLSFTTMTPEERDKRITELIKNGELKKSTKKS